MCPGKPWYANPMDSLRETYDLPEKAPPPLRQWAVMLAVPVALIAAWLILPDSAIVVAILAVLTLVAVFSGVAWVLRSPYFSDAPREPRRTRLN